MLAMWVACCLALELESSARQWQCGAWCVAELVVGMCSRVSALAAWAVASPQPARRSLRLAFDYFLNLQFINCGAVAASVMFNLASRVRLLDVCQTASVAPPRPARIAYAVRCGNAVTRCTILKEIAILRRSDPKSFLASQGRTVTDRELVSVTCRLHDLPSQNAN